MTVNDYLSSVDIKAAMPDESWGSAYDAEFTRLATAASRELDRITHRAPGAYAVTTNDTRFFQGRMQGQFVPDYELWRGIGHQDELWIDELAAPPTSVSMTIDTPRGVYTLLAGSSASIPDYYTWPYNAVGLGVPITKLILDIYNGNYALWYSWNQAVKVVGPFGYSTTVPADIQQAATIMAVRHFKRGQQAFADGSANATLGQMVYVKGLDPAVDNILHSGGWIRTVI